VRYVTVPEPFPVLNPVNDEPTGERVTFEQTVRLIAMQLVPSVDALSLIDLRRKFQGKSHPHVVEITEDEWKMAEPQFRRPSALSPAFVLNAESHLRAWLDAPSKRPAVLAEAENGQGSPVLATVERPS